mgnify:CR=1 FL=1
MNDIEQNYGLFNPKSIDVSAAERPSIIIMPFKNLSGDDSEGIADGIRLTLHSTLIKLPGLFLIHTGTVEKYRGQAPSPEEVRKEINTKYIINGSIQKIGNQIRITIEVTDTEQDQMILSERYDRIIHDIFSLQDEIAFEITKTLGVEFFGLDNEDQLHKIKSGLEKFSEKNLKWFWDIAELHRNKKIWKFVDGTWKIPNFLIKEWKW